VKRTDNDVKYAEWLRVAGPGEAAFERIGGASPRPQTERGDRNDGDYDGGRDDASTWSSHGALSCRCEVHVTRATTGSSSSGWLRRGR